MIGQEKLRVNDEITGIGKYEKATTSSDGQEQEVELDGDTFQVDNDLEDMKEYSELKGNLGQIIYCEEGALSPVIAKYRQTETPRYVLFNPNG